MDEYEIKMISPDGVLVDARKKDLKNLKKKGYKLLNSMRDPIDLLNSLLTEEDWKKIEKMDEKERIAYVNKKIQEYGVEVAESMMPVMKNFLLNNTMSAKEKRRIKRKMKNMKRTVKINEDPKYLKYGRILLSKITNKLISNKKDFAVNRASKALWGSSMYPHYQEGDDYNLRGNIITDNGAGKLDGIAYTLEKAFIPITIIKTENYIVGIIIGEAMTQKRFDKLIG